MRQSFSQTIALIKSDMRHRCEYEHKTLAPLQLLKLMLNPAAVSTILYRVQIFFYSHRIRILAYMLQWLNSVVFTVHIDSRTQIGEGLFIMHPNYICIGPYVNIGKRCMMAHQNSITPTPFYEEGQQRAAGPTIGDDVMLGGGACIVGDVTIGNQVKISMNAAVDSSFQDHAVLFGVPAKNMAKPAADSASELVAA